ncbi:phage tail family protein [Streptomyces sp. SRF1]|uniref:phage distal tail protein n=1 Tax=Streptomyces sp. SRF1 TaxID=1549642 RepID=UPI0025B26593|nr:phage tail domain-containing protein [Streptomyces sp. SRF1]MDN3056176.1 phage tail family protein [Streptomyces sp. SRF1]
MAIGDQVTAAGHVQLGELLLGRGTPYRWRSLTGWEDLPALDSGSTPRPAAHGDILGRLLAQSRVVTLDDIVIRARPAELGRVVQQLGDATAVRDDEIPLVVQLDDRGPLLAWVRVTARAVPVGRGYTVGTITGAAVQFTASDPRRYELLEHTARASLPADEPGLDWNTGEDLLDAGLDWATAANIDGGLAFGAPGSTGTLTARNAGNAPAHPIVEFRGPVSMPSLTNLETGDALEYDLDLAVGDVLVVDTGEGTATLNSTASRLYTASARSVPETTFTLAPGTADMAFRAAPGSSDPAASVAVRWRSAYW